MVLIAENLHIISKTTKEAILNKDDDYILNIVKKASENNFTVFDLNIGPAKGPLCGAMKYLTSLLDENFNVNYSFDTSNFDEMRSGFEIISKDKAQNSFINSICADDLKIKSGFEITKAYGANIIALAFNPNSGIAKTSDERLELAFSILENAMQNEIKEEKLYFDPLVLPVSVAQNQANIVLETIRMLKEASPLVHTIVGLSNISNGSPKDIRPLLNRVFLILALGSGLDSAIVDGFDTETVRVYNLITEKRKNSGDLTIDINIASNSLDRLYFSLYNAVNCFGDIDDIEYNKDDITEANIIKTARILLDKEIYSHSFCVRNSG